ncbi:MAG: hypothetical protein WCO26_21675 [Deltaproteobacteria bacterium]
MAKNARKKTTVKKICAWCNRMMQNGTEPATHGICRPCGKKVMENHDRWTVRSSSVAGTPKTPREIPPLI